MTTKQQHRQQLQYLLYLLRHRRPGGASALAAVLGCHPRTAKNYIVILRRDGFDIKYDRMLRRYVLYETDN
ncbi:MAG: HTH domain-containing protein [Acinetobacter sp.]|nr:MAG: HTH domain-containing protein [Acinetobacter sp.]